MGGTEGRGPGFAVVDVETTGLYAKTDRLVEIAIVRLDEGGKVVDEFETLINPQRDVGPTHIHGLTASDVVGAPVFAEIAGDVAARIRGAIIVGHNVAFETRFLDVEFGRCGVALPSLPALCTLKLSHALGLDLPSRRLGSCCDDAGIELVDAHTAMGDARATAELLRHYLDLARGRGMERIADLRGGDLLAHAAWPALSSSRRPCPRVRIQVPVPGDSLLARIVPRLEAGRAATAELAVYDDFLERALADRRLTDDEIEELASVAAREGLKREDVAESHERYLHAIADAAIADGHVSATEERDLAGVAALLGADAAAMERAWAAARKKWDAVVSAELATGLTLAGKRVCFTGTLMEVINGSRITRAQAVAIAERAGLVVYDRFSPELDLVVAADPNSDSSKARRARDQGIRIVPERWFWKMIGLMAFEDGTTAESSAPWVKLDVAHAPVLCSALVEARLPSISGVTVRNDTSAVLRGARIEISLAPGVVSSASVDVPDLFPGDEVSLDDIPFGREVGSLGEVARAHEGRLSWRLRRDADVLAEGGGTVEVLPPRSWPGLRVTPALLASFVEYEDPAVAAFAPATTPGARPDVRAMLDGIIDAVAAAGVEVAPLTRGYHRLGLDVLTPTVVFGGRRASALELALAAAAVIEGAGLCPLLVLVEGHVLAGAWLVDDRFPEGVVEDAPRLRNLISLGHVVVFEPGRGASDGRVRAGRHLENDGDFLCALDIRVLRTSGFRPPGTTAAGVPGVVEALRTVDATDRPRPLAGASVPPEIAARFRKWQDRLLDLTLRNRLLNFRPGVGGGFSLAIPDLPRFEDRLADERTFEVVGRAETGTRSRQAADPDLERRRREDLDRDTLHCDLSTDELYARAVKLARQARVDLEEGGATTLHVTIGTLRWAETPSAEELRLAPLLLYPVELQLDKSRRRARLRRLAEDPVANVTLVEKMRRDYDVDLSRLAALDADDSGVDVKALLAAARAAIQRMPRWEVVEDAHVGLFAFTKFLMWRDLEDNGATFLDNPVVRHIASTSSARLPETARPLEADRVDVELRSADIPCVVDADSTQLAAVASALRGRSFVLQGPPGTGKSQTITNLVAAAVSNGKSVLFVSEKMAALEVVHRRLESVGLGDFCLELHSHKSNKKDVLASLGRALQRGQRLRKPAWEARSAELDELRGRLNEYAAALHRPHPIGWTFYDATARLRELDSATRLRLKADVVASCTASRRAAAAEAVGALAAIAKPSEPVQENPWRTTAPPPWSASGQSGVESALHDCLRAIAAVEEAATVAAKTLGIAIPASTAGKGDLAAVGAALALGPVIPAAVRDPATWRGIEARLQKYVVDARANEARRTALAVRWRPELYTLDVTSLRVSFQRWANAFFLFALFALWGPRKALRRVAQAALPPSKTVADDLSVAETTRTESTRLKSEAAWAATIVGDVCDASDLAAIEAAIKRSTPASAAVARLATSLAAPARSTLDQLGQASRNLSAALDELASREKALAERIGAQPGTTWPASGAGDHTTVLRAHATAWLQSMGRFRSWSLYTAATSQVAAAGFPELVEAHRRGQVGASDLEKSFEASLLGAWIDQTRDAEPALRAFDGTTQHRAVDRFRTLDAEHIAVGRQLVAATLEARIPSSDGAVVEGSEPGILHRELRKKARHMAVRKLLSSIPTLLPRLKPCVLMSPLSVAQYLPAAARRFDLVVFDEASQIGTHDAIGAIARGQQVVIVGDSRQLPPTTFFSRTLVEDDVPDDNDVVELESILEEALARQIPEQMLGWHYRSQHDSLIDFSNRHYYDGRLHVFPATRRHVDDLGVKWHPVADGVYLGGRTDRLGRTNPREAEALVRHLVDRLKRTTAGSRSFGVVTFSMAQQSLIEDLLDEARLRSPEIDAHFTGDEAVFVKNLENVQGDERDEIYFSICYAKDEAGKLRMHFGPLSNAGGERRLNVAITRARRSLHVFATMTYDQIDLARTGARGAAHLRAFLEHASRRGSAASAAVAASWPSAFEREIHEAIRALGHESDTRVGCGGYRVDLAVRDPGRPGTYLLGVECDGPSYGSGHSARDRDRLRRQVLESLGWRLHRVWSQDWWFDRDGEVKRLAAAIEAAAKEPLAAEPRIDVPELVENPPTGAGRADGPAVEPYVVASLAAAGDAEAFFAATSAAAIRSRILEVVAHEAPVHVDLLARRVCECWGITKLTTRPKKRLHEEIAALASGKKIVVRGDFVWSPTTAIEQFDRFRGPPQEGEAREAEHLPPEEIASAAAWVLSRSLALGRSELIRETARLFGISRVGKNVAAAFEEGLQLVEARGWCASEGERVRWTRS